MNALLRLPITLALFFTGSSTALAATDVSHIPFIPKHSTLVDGTLDDNEWKSARQVELNYVTAPYNNTTPPVATTAYLFEDGHALYVGFRAYVDDSTRLRAGQRNRDELGNDDMVSVKIDSFGDARKAFLFSANPYGAQSDLLDNEHSNKVSLSWDASWDAAATIKEGHYDVEFRIPLSSLQYKASKDEALLWGLELVRFHGDEVIYRIAQVPNDRSLACRLCQLEKISLFKERESQDTVSLITEYTSGWQRNRTSDEWNYTDNQNIGATIGWNITPSSQLMGTVNPDFSQVEADASALNVNEPFTLYFEERRAFFTEGAETFDSHTDLIYTRNIASPRWGLKSTNQFGDHNVSALLTEDTQTSILLPGTLGSSVSILDEESIQGAFRYRYAINNNASLGATATFREADRYYNKVVSVDGKYRVSDTGTLYYQDAFSQTRYPEAFSARFCYTPDCTNSEAIQARGDERITGRHKMIRYTEERENLYLWASRNVLDGDFRADLGFETEVGITHDELYAYYEWFNENSWWTSLWAGIDHEYKTSEDDARILKQNRYFVGLNGPWQSSLTLGLSRTDRIGFRDDISRHIIANNARQFSNDGWDITLAASPSSWLQSELYWSHANAIDFDGGRQGKEDYIKLDNTLRLSSSLEVGINLWHNPFSVEGQNLYTASIADFRLTYNPSNKHQLKVAAIHYRLRRSADLYRYPVDEYYRDWELQVIYTYEVNNLTRFYAGIASLDAQAGLNQPMRPTDQSAFVKISYGFSL